jgi:acyl-CoA synthetase (NDP forming)
VLQGVASQTASFVISRSLELSDDRWLTSEEARRLLGAYGLPLVPQCTALDAEAAVEAARALGFPAVVKTAVPGIHKTEAGGIALALASEEDVRRAAERIGCPVLVQPYLAGGVELIAGIVQDPVFGPLVAFGPGGVLAELVGEAGIRLAPLTDVDAEELVRTGVAGRLVAGFRGASGDIASLVDLLLRLSALAHEHPEVAELDLNPVLARPQSSLVLDVRARVRRPTGPTRLKTW